MEEKKYIHHTQDVSVSYTGENVSDDEIDLKEILVKIWRKRKFILICTLISFLLGIFIAITSPVAYKASSTFVPQTGQKGGGNLGGLASMMGVNLGSSMTGESLSPSVYPQIVKSVPFCREVMSTPITVKKSAQPITLYEYYTNKAYQNVGLLSTIKKYTLGLPGLILSSGKSEKDVAQNYTDTITGKVISLTKKEREVIDIIQKGTQLESNTKDGYITLGYTFPEPEAVALIAENMYATLEKYVKDFKAQKQLDNLQFVEASYQDARKDFLQKQASLASFQDANRDLISAMARTSERRLSSEYDVAFTVYNELAKQREQAKLAVKESTPVLTVINPVVVPNQKSAPKKAMIVAVFLFLGLIISIGWILIKPFFEDIAKNVKEKEDTKD